MTTGSIRLNSSGTVNCYELGSVNYHSSPSADVVLTFAQQASQDFEEMLQHLEGDYLNVYVVAGKTIFAIGGYEALNVGLDTQTKVSHLGVFYHEGRTLKLLWKPEGNKTVECLANKSTLLSELSKVFPKIDSIKNGYLKVKKTTYNVWKIKVESTNYYISTHNGLIAKEENNWEFIDFTTLSENKKLKVQTTLNNPVNLPDAQSIEELANKELKNILNFTENNKFFNVYKISGYTFFAKNANESLRVALASQDYICNSMCKRMQVATHGGVFYRKDKEFIPLWKQNRFVENRRPDYLNLKCLSKKLNEIFDEVSYIKLGVLKERTVRFIAWEVKTEDGIFYIPWHSGMLCKKEDAWEFEVKQTFEEVRSTYKVLRFSKTDQRDVYRVSCG
ncbi:MAG: hypothetical protein IKW39_00695 [Alphaproteobacteria bacterium]|nr:hypothetical protein [Alphaproteobacteria bacterium]